MLLYVDPSPVTYTIQAIFMLLPLIVTILLGLIPAFIAKNKGRNFILWWLYGVVLFLVALIHSLIIKDKSNQKEN